MTREEQQAEFDSQAEKFDRIAALIEDAQTIVVCAHTNPDGDALGSALGIMHVIEEHWPGKEVIPLLADPDPVPRLYRFLPGADSYQHVDECSLSPDLFVCVDLPTASRLADAREVLQRSRHVVVLDHHPAEGLFGDVHLARTDAAATGVVVTEFALHVGADITPWLATCLFCAIVTDTGRFQYQNADPESFEIASLLVDAGASPSQISLNVYQSFRLEYLHLESIVMGRIATFDHGRISYSYALASDLERTGAKPDECDGLIDIVRSVEGTEVCLFLKELPDGSVRGNIRAKGDHDVSSIAHAMGGGGHRAAAGFTARGSIDDVLAMVLPMLRQLVDGGPNDTMSFRAVRG